jgi:hypothetical protein
MGRPGRFGRVPGLAETLRLRRAPRGCIVVHRMTATFSSFAFTFRYWRTVADSRTSVI